MRASELTPELDLVGAALSRDGPAAEELVSLEGAKSGLRIGFSSNRAFPPVQHPEISVADFASIPESGVQFYTNNFAVPENGARKKIHGGSGSVGDRYGPGSTC